MKDRAERIEAILDDIATQTAEVDFVILDVQQALDVAIFLTELQLLTELDQQ